MFVIFKNAINEHAKEFQKINEKINIHKDISDLKIKVDFIFNKMSKKANGDVVEIIIRLIQIAAIIFAGVIILKALSLI